MHCKGEQGWSSDVNACLPPMWPRFKSWTQCYKWVELKLFVVGSCPCSEGFSPGYPVFLPPQKSTFLNSNSIGNLRATGLSVITLLCVTLVKLRWPHNGHAANKKETLQTKKKCCKQKRNTANKKQTLQIKKKKSCVRTRPKLLGSSWVFPSLFNLEKSIYIFYKAVVVAQFHSITPSLPVRHLETWGSNHMKRHGLIVGKFELNSSGRLMWTLLELQYTPLKATT